MVALESLLQLAEMVTQSEACADAPVLLTVIVSSRLVDRAVLTRDFVKVKF
jgi:hypothetical protein